MIQVVPILVPFPMEGVRHRTFPIVLDQMVSLSRKLKFDLWDGTTIDVSVKLYRKLEKIPKFSRLWEIPRKARTYWFLQFSGKVCLENVECSVDSKGEKYAVSLKEADRVSCEILSEEFQQRVSDFLLAANIAMPGTFNSDAGLIFVGNDFYEKTDGLFSVLDMAVQLAQDLEWPPISNLLLCEVWVWLNRVEGFKNGVGRGPIGRSVGAFSRLFFNVLGAQDLTQELVWSLIGLEAIYGRDNEGARSQLLRKSEVLLGKPLSQMKKLGRVYDHRSRFLHGDVDFPLRYTHFDGEEDFEDFLNENSESAKFAMAVLVSTLQQLVKRNLYNVEFGYTLTKLHNTKGITR